MKELRHPESSELSLIVITRALSDPVRLEILRQLMSAGELTCGQLNQGRAKSSMSHHFKVLREAGLITTRIEGKEHLNALRYSAIDKKYPGLLTSLLAAL